MAWQYGPYTGQKGQEMTKSPIVTITYSDNVETRMVGGDIWCCNWNGESQHGVGYVWCCYWNGGIQDGWRDVRFCYWNGEIQDGWRMSAAATGMVRSKMVEGTSDIATGMVRAKMDGRRVFWSCYLNIWGTAWFCYWNGKIQDGWGDVWCCYLNSWRDVCCCYWKGGHILLSVWHHSGSSRMVIDRLYS